MKWFEATGSGTAPVATVRGPSTAPSRLPRGGAGSSTGAALVPMPGANQFTYPCDRGIPGNVQTRGMHHFEAQVDGTVLCRYCGRRPEVTP